jgi:hypothetical protein
MGNRYCERGEIVAVSCEGRARDPASPMPALVYPLFPQQGETEPWSSKVRLASSSVIGLWLNDVFLRINSRHPCTRMAAR